MLPGIVGYVTLECEGDSTPKLDYCGELWRTREEADAEAEQMRKDTAEHGTTERWAVAVVMLAEEPR
jgi:hypothetical protein